MPPKRAAKSAAKKKAEPEEDDDVMVVLDDDDGGEEKDEEENEEETKATTRKSTRKTPAKGKAAASAAKGRTPASTAKSKAAATSSRGKAKAAAADDDADGTPAPAKSARKRGRPSTKDEAEATPRKAAKVEDESEDNDMVVDGEDEDEKVTEEATAGRRSSRRVASKATKGESGASGRAAPGKSAGSDAGAITDCKTLRGKTEYMIDGKWVKEEDVDRDLIDAFEENGMSIVEVLKQRVKDSGDIEYNVKIEVDGRAGRGQRASKVARLKWVEASMVPTEMLEEWKTEQKEKETSKKELRERRIALQKFLDEFKDVTVEFLTTASSIAINRSDAELLNAVVSARAGKRVEWLADATSTLTPKFFQHLLKLNPPTIKELQTFAIASLSYYEPSNFVLAIKQMIEMKTSEKRPNGASSVPALVRARTDMLGRDQASDHLPNDGPFTKLHWQCLTANSVDEVTEELNAETINAGSLGIYLTPMHCAALRGNLEIFKHLVSMGGDLTLTDTNDRPLFYYAAMGGKAWNLADEKATEMQGIHVASNGASPVLELLLTKIEGVLPERMINDELQNAIVAAVQSHCIKNATCLLSAKLARVAPLVAYETSAEFFSSVIDLRNVDFFFIANEESEHLKSEGALEGPITEAVANKDFPMFLAVLATVPEPTGKHDNLDVEDFKLEDHHADPFSTVDFMDDLALAAVQANSVPILRTLMEPVNNADPMSPARFRPRHVPAYVPDDVAGAKMMAEALSNGFVRVVRYLLARNISVNSRSDDGSAIFIKAVLNNHFECVRLCVEHGVDLNATLNDAVEKKPDRMEVDGEAEGDVFLPYVGSKITTTGVFESRASALKRMVEFCGGEFRVEATGSTHCILGKAGKDSKGVAIGEGGPKHQYCEMKKMQFLTEDEVIAAFNKIYDYVGGIHVMSASEVQFGGVLHQYLSNVDTATAKMLEYLLSNGVDVNILDAKKHTALEVLLKSEGEAAVPLLATLLKYMTKKEPCLIDRPHPTTHKTPFQEAILHDKYVYAKALFEAYSSHLNYSATYPVNLSKRDYWSSEECLDKESGETILHLCVRAGQVEMLELLLDVMVKRGENVNTPKGPVKGHTAEYVGSCPLHYVPMLLSGKKREEALNAFASCASVNFKGSE
ncbi:hypothetical protein HK101_010465 [Irineochytrium annulatum]|nr:hypothetical protein HK101_010465 [Irineochytrium annulatum]